MCIFVLLPPVERTKLSAQSSKCVFLGYGTDQKGFFCYDPKVKRIRTSRNVMFFENQYFFQHHLDHDNPAVVSFVPDFCDNHVPSTETIKPLLVYERRRRENTLAPEPPNLSASSALDPTPAPDISQSIPLR